MPVEVIKNDYTIVRASESIDLYNAEEFQAAMDKAVQDAPKGLIVDLSDATYMDSAGVQALFRAYQRVRAGAGRMALVLGNENMRELIGVVNLDMLPGMFVRNDMASAEQALAGR